LVYKQSGAARKGLSFLEKLELPAPARLLLTQQLAVLKELAVRIDEDEEALEGLLCSKKVRRSITCAAYPVWDQSWQDLRRLTLAIFGVLLLLQSVRAEIVSIVTWNLEWFPGGKPTSSEAERIVHMSAAKDALLDLHADILCLQEVRDWDSVAELISVLPGFQPLVVSRFREFGMSGPITIQQIAIASRWPAGSSWSESFKPSATTPPRGFSFAAIQRGDTVLLVYSVHLKSNRGEPRNDIVKREEAARQLFAHAAEMERVYSKSAKVITLRFAVCIGADVRDTARKVLMGLGGYSTIRARHASR
jgi:hypothetical protein